jgi:membrane-bound metal-dependent hydrolase YbcI (DUF457 family)
MADFYTHVTGAATASGMLATGLFMTGEVGNAAVVGYFVLGVTGGLLPDIDSNSSIPLRVAINVMGVVGSFLAVFASGRALSLLELVLLWAICFAAVRWGLFYGLTRFTTHRGLIHSIPAAGCFSLGATLVAWHVFAQPALQAWLCAVFLGTGYLVHLLLDEYYSVNLMGMKLKASFGSALSLGSRRQPLGTALLYLLCIGLLHACPSPAALLDFIANSEVQRRVCDRVLPERERLIRLQQILFRWVDRQ